MTHLNRHPRRGIIITDLFLIIAILILSYHVLVEAGNYLDKRYSGRCFTSQKEIDKTMWDVIYENRKDIARLSAGYVLRNPDGQLQMILIFLPEPGKNYPEEIAVDLKSRNFSAKGVCPLHRKLPKDQPVIDYWYGAGRWWCLHSKYHN